MFRTEPMYKLRILCLEKEAGKVVELLHKLNTIELRRSKLELSDIQNQESTNKLNEALVRVEGALSFLEEKEHSGKIKHMDLSTLFKKIESDKAIDEIYALNDRRKIIEDELKLASYAENVSKKLKNIKVNFSKLSSNFITLRAFELPSKDTKKLVKKLESSVKNIEILSSKNGKLSVLLIAYEKKANIDEIIKAYEVTEFDLSSKYLLGTPAQTQESSYKKIKQLNFENEEITKKLKELSKSSYLRIAAYFEMLKIELERTSASSMFKKTDSTVVVEGWIPKKSEAHLVKELNTALSGRVYIERVDEKDELAPTLIKHPKFLRSFDYMIEFFSLPRSDEIDPSWIFIISFPIFYGFMISDVGYGIMSLILSTLIKKKTDPNGLMYNTATLWQINSISAMFFGFISNQYLGMPFNQYFTGFTGINWFSDISYIAVVSIIFGLTQILLGLVFGFINEYRHHKKKLAVAKLTSFALVFSGTLAIAGGLFGALSYNITLASTITAIISLILTLILSGERALEVIDLISHTLSYMRIMGFGLASVIIAFLIDFAFTPKLSDGILVFIIYLVIFLLLHVLNMIVSIFEGLVQGLRLNFVEFFTKFYEGGGVKFKPFSYKRVYTKE